MSQALNNALSVTPHGGRTDANKWTYITEEVGRPGIPSAPLVSVLPNSPAGTPLNQAKPVTVKIKNFAFHNHDFVFSIIHRAHLFPVLSLMGQQSSTQLAHQKKHLKDPVSFPSNGQICLQEKGSRTTPVNLMQQIKDGWISSVQSPLNGAGNRNRKFYCLFSLKAHSGTLSSTLLFTASVSLTLTNSGISQQYQNSSSQPSWKHKMPYRTSLLTLVLLPSNQSQRNRAGWFADVAVKTSKSRDWQLCSFTARHWKP